jgi:pyruvate formate lyase activating enzyme
VEADSKSAVVLEIKGNSLDDGPGIRTVVFLKGCPLSCAWCHNPESKRTGRELSFDSAKCIGCNSCIDICGENALVSKYPDFVDRERCTLCFKCADACPSGALSQVGREMSVPQILEEILPDKPFFDNSGGGVTLSGGEPVAHPDFVSDLLQALKKKHIHTLVETSGHFHLDAFMEKLYPFIDMMYFDLKLIDRAAHKLYCGVPNDRIIENLTYLSKIAPRDRKPLLPRVPLVPGITDTRENLEGIAELLVSLGLKRATLLPFNPLWHEKRKKIGALPSLQKDPRLTEFMAQERIEDCKAIFASFEIRLF